MTDKPILMQWNGDGFTPASPYWTREADKLFVIGQKYALIEHKPGQTLDPAPAKDKEPVEIASDAKVDPAAPAEGMDQTYDALAEWLDEQIAIANNMKASEELDELDPRVWKRLRDAGRAKDLGEKWETEGFNPNMNRLDPARKAKK
ncbi:MAG: hypothetical protein J0H10_17090 [Alphaproteobacteria bacterium]|nr:hypothetical protein [Alphaproteobacteria bacterium]